MIETRRSSGSAGAQVALTAKCATAPAALEHRRAITGSEFDVAADTLAGARSHARLWSVRTSCALVILALSGCGGTLAARELEGGETPRDDAGPEVDAAAVADAADGATTATPRKRCKELGGLCVVTGEPGACGRAVYSSSDCVGTPPGPSLTCCEQPRRCGGEGRCLRRSDCASVRNGRISDVDPSGCNGGDVCCEGDFFR